MPSLDRKLVARDQFSFSCSSLPRTESAEEFGLSFGEWTESLRNQSSSLQELSPASRAQAIASYKKEMLEFVKDAPENVYDLSLTDLVELKESPVKERLQLNKPRTGKRHFRSESVESGGFLLKIFFPIPSSRRKRSTGSFNGGLKYSSRSSSSGSSSSDSGSSATNGTVKLGSGSKVSMKDGKKTSCEENSAKEYVRMQQHRELSRNCSR
ncbi:uncharacterized protein A4U43_C10F8840 [Asparagus officinalis]|uniref:Uncharacterized protein n=2 Tax=Asparagus officinalis TaxID=4686 RepID=A0A5P1E1H1_ASPOF|nr:uncharacterized protein A4U43_C10F8840 [Asparagus officinalis]